MKSFLKTYSEVKKVVLLLGADHENIELCLQLRDLGSQYNMPQDSKYLLVRYSSVVLRNLKILNYDFDTYNVPKQADSFL